jgi:hypothetical protein
MHDLAQKVKPFFRLCNSLMYLEFFYDAPVYSIHILCTQVEIGTGIVVSALFGVII